MADITPLGIDAIPKIIKQGAEARIYKSKLFGKNVIVKERFQKKYRHPTLDTKLTHKRTLQEARAILKCRKAGIKTPVVYFLDLKNHKIYMEEIENSLTLREKVNNLLKVDNKISLKSIAFDIGQMISLMHQNEVIHGDLTTSNILIQDKDENSIFTLIDFGLSFISNFVEDMGVDLYVLERAFLSTHPNTEWLFACILESYKNCFKDGNKVKDVFDKLEEIRSRGRKRVMVG